ncbi:MAG: DNA adenine methylase [Clostridium fessum]
MQIECMDAVKLIGQYNHKNVLIYCDPPYIA